MQASQHATEEFDTMLNNDEKTKVKGCADCSRMRFESSCLEGTISSSRRLSADNTCRSNSDDNKIFVTGSMMSKNSTVIMMILKSMLEHLLHKNLALVADSTCKIYLNDYPARADKQ